MSSLSALTSFFYNNRRKFIVGGIIIGGSVAAYYFANYKLREAHAKSIEDMLESIRRQRYFESIDETCNQTVVDIDKMLQKHLMAITNIPKVLDSLNNNPKNKIALWEELKILSFTHLIILIYTEALLVTLIRIQLGVIGGYTYQEKITDKSKLNQAAQKKYLSLFINFAKSGLKDFFEFVQNRVSIILSKISLTDCIDVHKLQQTFWSIQNLISNDEENLISSLTRYLNIEAQMAKTTDVELKEVYSETVDILSNTEVIGEINSCVSLGFVFFIDQLIECFPIENSVKSSSPQSIKSIYVAKLIPIICNLCLSNGNSETTSVWIKHLMISDKLKVLCANVYEAYCS